MLTKGTNTTNIAHLRIFVRGVFTNFETLEEFVGLVSMQSTTIDKDILKAKVQCPNKKFLKVQFWLLFLL